MINWKDWQEGREGRLKSGSKVLQFLSLGELFTATVTRQAADFAGREAGLVSGVLS